MIPKYFYIFGLIIIMMGMTPRVNAHSISVDEAMIISQAFVQNNFIRHRNQVCQEKITLALTATGKYGYTYYVFNTGEEGFVIVSGEDEAQQILAYSEQGHFDYKDLPEHVKAWLQQYSDQIDFLKDHHDLLSSHKQLSYNTIVVAPMVEDLSWGQDAPFNALCPTDNGVPTKAGCVAVAMSQIMKYHNWPLQGKGSHSYTITIGSTTTTLSADFSQSYYDWDNILPNYFNVTTSEINNHAVAHLLLDAGIAVNMNYGVNVSTAFMIFAASAFKDYFDYDNTVNWINRTNYTDDQWLNKIYNELENNRPILYSGDSSGSSIGHAFVLDGSDGNGYFHFNFGWYGNCDGYYLLSALQPGYYDFSYDQDMIIGIQRKPVIASGLTLSPEHIDLEVGSSTNLTATITPNNVTKRILSWSSSNPMVATIEDNGMVRALADGSSIITARTTDGSNLEASSTISVTQATSQSIKGDVNGDNKVNISDATILVSYLHGKHPETFIESRSDVNGDGAINISDAVAIVRIILTQ